MRKKKEEIVFSVVHTHNLRSSSSSSSKSARSIYTPTTRTDSAQKPRAFESIKIQRVQFNRHTNRTKRLSTPSPSRRSTRAYTRVKKILPKSGKKRRKKKEQRTAVCNNSSSYWPARVTTLVLLATDALETTTFAPRRVVWVSADIISIYSCAYKSKVKLSLSHSLMRRNRRDYITLRLSTKKAKNLSKKKHKTRCA